MTAPSQKRQRTGSISSNMLADNLIDLKQSELMIDWCAGVLDTGSLGTAES